MQKELLGKQPPHLISVKHSLQRTNLSTCTTPVACQVGSAPAPPLVYQHDRVAPGFVCAVYPGRNDTSRTMKVKGGDKVWKKDAESIEELEAQHRHAPQGNKVSKMKDAHKQRRINKAVHAGRGRRR